MLTVRIMIVSNMCSDLLNLLDRVAGKSHTKLLEYLVVYLA